MVVYATPSATDNCAGLGAATCTPASGTVFQKGTTTVACSVADASGNSTSCLFTVTVNDTEAPGITCPLKLTRVAPASCPIATSLTVTYAGPAATDNCPGVTTACLPPSGSSFPLGTTTVLCTASDTSGNRSNCSFTVTVFNVCVQDDSNPNARVLINSASGQYQFFCGGNVYSGTGSITIRGCMFTLAHDSGGRRLRVTVDIPVQKGTAVLEILGTGTSCQITDRNLANNNCNGG